jgi:hypothetical protein
MIHQSPTEARRYWVLLYEIVAPSSPSSTEVIVSLFCTMSVMIASSGVKISPPAVSAKASVNITVPKSLKGTSDSLAKLKSSTIHSALSWQSGYEELRSCSTVCSLVRFSTKALPVVVDVATTVSRTSSPELMVMLSK